MSKTAKIFDQAIDFTKREFKRLIYVALGLCALAFLILEGDRVIHWLF